MCSICKCTGCVANCVQVHSTSGVPDFEHGPVVTISTKSCGSGAGSYEVVGTEMTGVEVLRFTVKNRSSFCLKELYEMIDNKIDSAPTLVTDQGGMLPTRDTIMTYNWTVADAIALAAESPIPVSTPVPTHSKPSNAIPDAGKVIVVTISTKPFAGGRYEVVGTDMVGTEVLHFTVNDGTSVFLKDLYDMIDTKLDSTSCSVKLVTVEGELLPPRESTTTYNWKLSDALVLATEVPVPRNARGIVPAWLSKRISGMRRRQSA